MKKRFILAALAILAAALVLLLLSTVPVYPAFQKTVDSTDALRRALRSKAFLYPAAGEVLSDTSYRLSLDGRTVFSKPVGYLIDGTEPDANAGICYVFSGSTKSLPASAPKEQHEYRGVPIGIWTYGDLADCTKTYQIGLSFSSDGIFYVLRAAVSGTVPDSDAPSSSEQRAGLAAHAEDTLLSLCHQMLDGTQAS